MRKYDFENENTEWYIAANITIYSEDGSSSINVNKEFIYPRDKFYIKSNII